MIWTRVAVSISYNDNHYNTGTLYNCANKELNAKKKLSKNQWNIKNVIMIAITYKWIKF